MEYEEFGDYRGIGPNFTRGDIVYLLPEAPGVLSDKKSSVLAYCRMLLKAFQTKQSFQGKSIGSSLSSFFGAMQNRQTGNEVEVKLSTWKKYQKGHIIDIRENGAYDVKFTGIDWQAGDEVKAMVKGWTKYYKGKITHVHTSFTYDIQFEDGDKKSGVGGDQIKKTDGLRRK